VHRPSRILAIEPDPDRAGTLRELVREYVDADVVVAPSMDAAVTTLAERPPTLILTSAFLSPRDAGDLTAHLKQAPHLRVPVLTIPPVVDPIPAPRGGLRSLFGRRQAPRAFAREALGLRIREAFEQSRSEPGLLIGEDLGLYGDASGQDAVRHRRARRLTGGDVGWLSGVRLASGLDVRLVNISSTGLLIESGSDLMPGSSTTFQLWGPARDLWVPAHIVRSELSRVGASTVKFQAAASFDRELEMLASGFESGATPAGLDDLEARLRAHKSRGADQAALLEMFESGLRQLVPARDIGVRAVPMVEDDGSESVYFTVPTGAAIQPILQATFAPNQAPSREEFETLSAAANLAATILR
jgi:hypothetical protein